MTPLRWAETAVVEALEAADFYGERSARGAQWFGEQLWAAIALIREYPEAGAPYGLPYRRVPFRQYPYSIVYLVDEDGIFVAAVKHDRMMPVRWEEQL